MELFKGRITMKLPCDRNARVEEADEGLDAMKQVSNVKSKKDRLAKYSGSAGELMIHQK